MLLQGGVPLLLLPEPISGLLIENAHFPEALIIFADSLVELEDLHSSEPFRNDFVVGNQLLQHLASLCFAEFACTINAAHDNFIVMTLFIILRRSRK